MELGLFDPRAIENDYLLQWLFTSVDREAAHGPHCLPV